MLGSSLLCGLPVFGVIKGYSLVGVLVGVLIVVVFAAEHGLLGVWAGVWL